MFRKKWRPLYRTLPQREFLQEETVPKELRPPLTRQLQRQLLLCQKSPQQKRLRQSQRRRRRVVQSSAHRSKKSPQREASKTGRFPKHAKIPRPEGEHRAKAVLRERRKMKTSLRMMTTRLLCLQQKVPELRTRQKLPKLIGHFRKVPELRIRQKVPKLETSSRARRAYLKLCLHKLRSSAGWKTKARTQHPLSVRDLLSRETRTGRHPLHRRWDLPESLLLGSV
mmetsp:Transcript_112441/g.210868  ORF Transcript_112441/g.210868 Transcript_112441/m.210868 type:complete len:225 (-) Transcript_112441:848-1522(-)